MRALLFIPIVLSLVVLGAHFLRDGFDVGVAVCVVLIGLLFVRRVWAARIIQLALVLGAFEWVLTLYTLAQVRAAHGMPATRLVIILAAVAVVTLLSTFLFQTSALKNIYKLDSGGSTDA
ncbi:MAG TPA: hypothetical protein VLA11_03885 [Woeseiaceae bacterium]|nr:hypothetical protein [Woeseiaceae bacterium]